LRGRIGGRSIARWRFLTNQAATFATRIASSATHPPIKACRAPLRRGWRQRLGGPTWPVPIGRLKWAMFAETIPALAFVFGYLVTVRAGAGEMWVMHLCWWPVSDG
jgi:hypothetical protein